MRQTIRCLTVGFLTLLSFAAGARAEETPVHALPQESQLSTTRQKMWEVDGAFFKSLSGQDSSQLGTARLLGRRFLNETRSVSAGLELRFWPAGSYPLSSESSSANWSVGGAGQLYLFRNRHLGVYLGGSLLWIPSDAECAFAPEVGLKWFASPRLALGISYWILSDIGSYTTSFEPPNFGKSRQSLGLELSVYL